jgi:hypothetical protein
VVRNTVVWPAGHFGDFVNDNGGNFLSLGCSGNGGQPFVEVSQNTYAQDEGSTSLLAGGGNTDYIYSAPRTVTFALPNDHVYMVLIETAGASCKYVVTSF